MSQALAAGVKFFQYRSKSSPRSATFHTSLRLASLARNAGALFLVNDHADIAAAVDADGVHLGQDDMPLEYARKLLGWKKIIGLSTHDADQARQAEKAGADYIGFGPVFKTGTKDAGPVQGIARLAHIRKTVSVPVVAIGGICQNNVRDALNAGADGVAVISAILSTPDIRLAAAKMIKIIKSGSEEGS